MYWKVVRAVISLAREKEPYDIGKAAIAGVKYTYIYSLTDLPTRRKFHTAANNKFSYYIKLYVAL